MSKALVRAKKTGHLYIYHGDELYENLVTGAMGKIRDENASVFFVIPVLSNKIFEQCPDIIDIIRLGFDIETETENIQK